MEIRITKNFLYKNVFLFCEGKKYDFSKDNYLEITTSSNSAQITVTIQDKNLVYPDIIDFVCGIISPENSICRIRCLCTFDVMSSSERCDVVLSNISKNCENIYFDSVFAKSENSEIKTVQYKPNNIESVRKKHMLLQLLLLSTIPVMLLLLIFCLIDFSLDLLAILVLDLFVFVLPSFKRIKKFNSLCNESTAENLLFEAELTYDDNFIQLPQKHTKIKRIILNILDKL